MKRCSSCDHFSAADAVECERCGARLPSESMEGASAGPSNEPAPDSLEGVVLETARKGGKIAAIKIYREQRGGSLKEAKEAVEALMAEHGVTASASSGGGCGASVLAVVVLIMAVIRLVA